MRADFVFIFMLSFGVVSQAQVTGTGEQASVVSATTFKGFDVISVKPDKSGSGNMGIRTEDSSFSAENVSIKMLLVNAYGVRDGLIFGIPTWASGTRWDINAKLVDPDPALKDRHLTHEQGRAEYRAKLLSILSERFHLKAHLETRELPVYDLIVAKDGSKFQETQAPENRRGNMSVNNTAMESIGIPMSSLADMLSDQVGRTVVDRTGMKGDYDLKLKWTSDDQAANASDNGTADSSPGITTALQEQLGLKLVSGKGPVSTLVVDSIAMPTAD